MGTNLTDYERAIYIAEIAAQNSVLLYRQSRYEEAAEQAERAAEHATHAAFCVRAEYLAKNPGPPRKCG